MNRNCESVATRRKLGGVLSSTRLPGQSAAGAKGGPRWQNYNNPKQGDRAMWLPERNRRAAVGLAHPTCCGSLARCSARLISSAMDGSGTDAKPFTERSAQAYAVALPCPRLGAALLSLGDVLTGPVNAHKGLLVKRR